MARKPFSVKKKKVVVEWETSGYTVDGEHRPRATAADDGRTVLTKAPMVLRSRPASLRTLRRLYGTTRANIVGKSEQDARWLGWQVVIGIEVHAQIKSREKLFSRE
jgi:hypothetical protein